VSDLFPVSFGGLDSGGNRFQNIDYSKQIIIRDSVFGAKANAVFISNPSHKCDGNGLFIAVGFSQRAKVAIQDGFSPNRLFYYLTKTPCNFKSDFPD